MSEEKNLQSVTESAPDTVSEASSLEPESIEGKKEKKSKPALDKQQKKESFRKKLKYGGLSVTFTVIFVAAVVIFNIIVNLALSRFDLKADLTDNSIYSIQDSTKEYLSKMEDSIDIIVMATEEKFVQFSFGTYVNAFNQTNEILKRFKESSQNIKVTYTDLLQNPKYANDFAGVMEGDIVIQSKTTGRYKILTYMDYLDIDDSNYYYGYGDIVVKGNAEQAFLSTIMIVSDANPVKVAVSSGFGEGNSYALQTFLSKNGFELNNIDLNLLDKIDEDYELFILYSPSADLDIRSLSKIDAWLDNGGKYGKTLLYFPSITKNETPNLDAYLKDWGLAIERAFIYQTNLNYAYPLNPLLQKLRVTDSDFSSDMPYGSEIFTEAIRPITILWDAYSNYEVTPLVSSYDGAVLRPFEITEDWTPDNQQKSSLHAVVESRKVRFESTTPYYSRVFALGSPFIVYNDYLGYEQYMNAKLILNIANISTGRDDISVSIPPKSYEPVSFQISAAEANRILILVLLVVVAFMITGIVIWLRRRKS